MMGKLINVSFRLATEEDSHIPVYDNTKLTAINTCPTWGIVRYIQHKTFATGNRAMALEAGAAMHEVFAAVRLIQLFRETLARSGEDLAWQFMDFHGARLFGFNRYNENLKPKFDANEDTRTLILDFCLEALYTSGFYDDPKDRFRTLSNLEEAAILYIDRWNWNRYPIWVRDPDDPQSDVGIEYPFDIVLEYTFEGNIQRNFRFSGKFDGIQWNKDDLCIGENKTGSRLNDAWSMSFELSSQITGYCLAASVWTGHAVNKGIIFGTQIPIPKSYEDGIVVENVKRETHHFRRWLMWFLHTVELAERYQHDPANAPRYTHSCNRYFRPCSFVSLCSGTDDEFNLGLQEMITEEWSPLHEKSGD
ncbi:PD-(D/E)XK nuclease family protein [Microcystis sp. M60BS1]|nr:PD-(D/E)XK nuclease family protein [Microcystis sp. M60BS1]MCA2603422.1 PD-(D/E)XK nuclease family protein [Microcystis sp. M26BS1]